MVEGVTKFVDNNNVENRKKGRSVKKKLFTIVRLFRKIGFHPVKTACKYIV